MTSPSVALTVAAVVLAIHPHAVAQDAPDLSGTWVLESTAAPQAGVPRAITFSPSVALTNALGEPITPFVREMTITRVSDEGLRSETYRVGVVGGRVGGVALGDAPVPRSRWRVQWEDRALVIETGTASGSSADPREWPERREVWALDQRRRLRGTISTRHGADGWHTVIAQYRRQ